MRFRKLTVRDLGTFRGERSWSIPEGLVAVTGPNGAGKTTLLGLLLGGIYRDVPTRGSLVALAHARDSFVEVEVDNGASWRLRQSCDAVSRKSEASVMHADGSVALESTKVTDADAWVSEHFPPLDLVLQSVFSVQGSGGFCAASAGDRKAILLRLQGVERLEAMSRGARDRAALVAGEVAKIEALLAPERARADEVDALGAEHAVAGTRAEAAATRARAARAELEDSRAELVRYEAALGAYQIAVEARRKLEAELGDAYRRHADLRERIDNNRALFDEAEAIRDAAKRLAELEAAATETRERAVRGQAEAAEARAAVAPLVARLGDAERTLRDLDQTAERARMRLAQKDAIAEAVRTLPALREARSAAVRALGEAERVLEALGAERLAGAEDRIDGLREGLELVCDMSVKKPRVLARHTLVADDAAVARAAELPAHLEQARQGALAARQALDRAREGVACAEQLAVREGDIRAAKAELAELREADRAAVARLDELRDQIAAARREAAERDTRAEATLAAWNGLLERAAVLRPLADKLGPLERAEARLGELTPQADELRRTIEALDAELARPEPPAPRPPRYAVIETAVAELEDEARRQAGAVAAVGERLRFARAAQERVAELEGELRAASAELADWTRLGADLGRKGLQAALVDAALGEVTALTNELLHAAFGARWSVRFESQRSDARGTRQIEGLDVVVVDNERGREAPIETYSGGERTILSEAVALALSALACRSLGTEEGPTLIRDESGAALDPEKAEAYVAMLRRAARMIGSRTVLLVSHSPTVQALCDDRLAL